MTIRHLRILMTVADTGQMSAAARQLYITQPTVSQAIADIEAAYGVRIFERLSRRLYITPAGAQMLDYARHIVASFDEMEERMRSAAQNPLLHVGATITVGGSVMPDIVSGFEARYPESRIHVTVDNTVRMEELLLKSLLDVALMEGAVKSSELLTKPVIRDELVLIVPMRHPFAGRESVRPQELAGTALCAAGAEQLHPGAVREPSEAAGHRGGGQMVLPKCRRHSQCGGGRAGLIGGFPSGGGGRRGKGVDWCPEDRRDGFDQKVQPDLS